MACPTDPICPFVPYPTRTGSPLSGENGEEDFDLLLYQAVATAEADHTTQQQQQQS